MATNPTTGSIMAMTGIGTSDPISLCDGFALFPGADVHAGIFTNGNGTKQYLLQTAPQVLVWRFRVSAAYEVFMGLCGPAYAILFDTPSVSWFPDDQDSTQQAVAIQVTNDQLQAGFVVGFTIAFPISFSVQEWVVTNWWTPWKGEWEAKLNLAFTPKFDLLNIIATIILKILEEEGATDTFLQKVNALTPSLLGSQGFFDEKKNQFADNQGMLSVNPTFTVPINLVPMIPVLQDINAALALLLGYLRAGPTIGISIPTTVTLDKVRVDGNSYPVTSIDDTGRVVGSGGPDIAGTPQKVGVELEHQPGFDIDLGVSVSAGVLKLFNLGASFSFPLLALLGVTVKLGPFFNTLDTPVGGQPTSSLGSSFAPAPIEVVFEPVEQNR